ncbi:MAG: hypothetical protein ACK46X_04145 [Candidatus Sericytochromatia bacterium]
MTATEPQKTRFSRFAMALLVGGLIAVGVGSTSLYRAQAAEADSVLVPAVVTQVGDRQGRFMPVTYRYEAPGPDSKPRQLEKTVMAPVGLVEKWAPERQVQVRMAKADPAQSDLAESGIAVATGLQWMLFGALATVFGTLRLHKKPDEA